MDEITIPELAYYQMRTAQAELQLAKQQAQNYLSQAEQRYDTLLREACESIDPEQGRALLETYVVDLERKKLTPRSEVKAHNDVAEGIRASEQELVE